MKNLITLIFLIIVFGVTNVVSAEIKIASVDTERLYTLYYKRFVLEEQLQKERNEIIHHLESKEKELDEKSFLEYKQNKIKEYRDKISNSVQSLVYKIENTIKETEKKEGYDLIINSSARVSDGAPFKQKVSPYINSAYDITPIILKKINQNAPEGFDPEKKLKELYGN